MVKNKRFTLREGHPVHPKFYLQAGFHCLKFCAQMSRHKFKNIYYYTRKRVSENCPQNPSFIN